MHTLIFSLAAALSTVFLTFSGTVIAQDSITDKATGKSFPREISIDIDGKPHKLEITGVATRKKFFVNVYSVAHYIENANDLPKGNAFDAILKSDKPKQLTLIWARDASEKKVVEGYHESFDKVLGKGQSQSGQLKQDIDKFIGFFGNVKSNDKQVIRWLPGGVVNLEINGKNVGSIKNPEFAETLWSIWFGRRSVVERGNLVKELR